MARRMAELFYNSLPRQIEVEFLGYDYLSLKHAEELEGLKSRYDILFVSGTANPELKDVAFIPMEDIISMREIERIGRMFFSVYAGRRPAGLPPAAAEKFFPAECRAAPDHPERRQDPWTWSTPDWIGCRR